MIILDSMWIVIKPKGKVSVMVEAEKDSLFPRKWKGMYRVAGMWEVKVIAFP